MTLSEQTEKIFQRLQELHVSCLEATPDGLTFEHSLLTDKEEAERLLCCFGRELRAWLLDELEDGPARTRPGYENCTQYCPMAVRCSCQNGCFPSMKDKCRWCDRTVHRNCLLCMNARVHDGHLPKEKEVLQVFGLNEDGYGLEYREILSVLFPLPDREIPKPVKIPRAANRMLDKAEKTDKAEKKANVVRDSRLTSKNPSRPRVTIMRPQKFDEEIF